jgi:fatty acid desaturase
MSEANSSEVQHRRQRQAIAWGAGAFLGIGIGGALALALDAWLTGLVVAVAIALVVAGAYLMAGHATAENRAARIVAREELADEDEDDDGTY